MNQGKRYDNKFKNEIIREYKGGKPVKEIAQKFNISQSSIYKWVNSEFDDENLQMDFISTSENINKKDNIGYIREISKLRKEYETVLKENEILKKTISVLIK